MRSVRHDKCRDDPDPTMGYDRDLDNKVRVGFRFIPSSHRRGDVGIVHRFHNEWEFWVYNVVFGLFQAPYYAFAQTMMAELTPPGFDNMVRTVSQFSPMILFVNLIGEMQVLQPLRIVEHLIVDDRTKRNPGDHQQVRKQLGRIPVLISSLHLRQSGYLVCCGCAERTAGRCALGSRAAWDGVQR